MMATEAIKLICGVGTPLLGRVAFLDVLDGRQFEIPCGLGRSRPAPHPSLTRMPGPSARYLPWRG